MHGARLASRNAGIGTFIVLSALALLLRILVPAGFMPSTTQGYAISLCSDMSGMSAWVDQAGKLHKGEKPSGDETTKHQPCVFGGFASALALPDVIGPTSVTPLAAAAVFIPLRDSVAIGRGLAAPPPPPTGPPAHL